MGGPPGGPGAGVGGPLGGPGAGMGGPPGGPPGGPGAGMGGPPGPVPGPPGAGVGMSMGGGVVRPTTNSPPAPSIAPVARAGPGQLRVNVHYPE